MISISYKLSLSWISVLLYTSLFASIPIQVNSAPLPDPGDLVINLAQRTEHSYSLKLKVTTIGTEEHVALVMGKFLVQAVFKSEDAPLKGNFVPYEDNISDGLLPLNAHVQFSSQDAFAAEVLRLSKMTLAPHRPDQEGGNCADYVKKVLEQLAAIPNALVPPEVPKEFTVWYAKNSKRISEGTRAAMNQEHK